MERIELLQQRLLRTPNDARDRRALAIARASTGDLDNAAREFAAALTVAPNDPLLHAEYAAVVSDLAISGRRGAQRESWDHLELALALRPDFSEALLLKTRLLIDRDEWREALDVAQPALAGDPGAHAPRVAALLVTRARSLAARDEWLAAVPLWHEAATLAPEAARPALLELLREGQDVLLSPPRRSWLVYPPVPDRQRTFQYAAAAFVAAVACLVLFVVLAGNEATLVLSVLPLVGTVAAPVAILLVGRGRLRRRAAPHGDFVARIRANPATIFRGEPAIDDLLAALEYVAAERQGEAMARENPWLLGRGSAIERRARRGALLRAPWLPSGRDDEALR